MRKSSRYAWLWLLPFVWQPCALVASAHAAGGQAVAWTDEGTVDEFDDQMLFVVGNTLFTVYHELGHALIDMLRLPVIGREEDAVDGFAAVTMIPDRPEPLRDALIVAVADGWRALSDLTLEDRERNYWGEHALDQQRHFTIVCLMVGSDQEGFYDFALEAGLPEARIASCARDFMRMKSGWKRLLAPHRPAAERTGQPVEPPITMIFDEPLPEQRGLLDLISEGGLLEKAILRFGDEIALPKPITIRFSACEDTNAYWSQRKREVIICYELIDEFEAILLGAVLR